jgi:beta-mannosidase
VREQKTGVLKWRLTNTSGKLLASNTLDCTIKPLADNKVMGLQFADHLKEYGPRNVLFWIDLRVDGSIVSQDVVFFARPKHLELRIPQFDTQVRECGDGAFDVTVSASAPALWMWPDLSGVKATYSDRFFHLYPDEPATITIRPEQAMSQAQFEDALQIRNLVDTWR